MQRKVGIIGAGHVGECTAMYLAERNICDIVIVDIIEDMPKGKGLDLTQAGPIRGYDCTVVGSNDFADLKGCELVVHTAGLPRRLNHQECRYYRKLRQESKRIRSRRDDSDGRQSA